MAGDHAGGVFLSQLVYWAVLPAKGSDEWTSRLSIERFGRKWLAKSYKEWWEECRLKPSQVTRIVRLLREKGLIETRIMKFHGSPTLHISMNYERFLIAWAKTAQRDPSWAAYVTMLRGQRPRPRRKKQKDAGGASSS